MLLTHKAEKQNAEVYFLSLISLLNNKPTSEELAIMHFPRNLNKHLKAYQTVHQKYSQSLEQVAESTRASILDLSHLIETPEQRTIFTDTMHMNDKGAERIGQYLAEVLSDKVASIGAERTP